MNYGHYFSVNHEFSPLSDELQVYSYRPLEDKNDKTFRFPVYVTLSRERIDFYVHYFSERGELNSTHLHTAFFSIPVMTHPDKNDRLVRALAEVYETPYPPSSDFPEIPETGPDYLFQLVDQLRRKIQRIRDLQKNKTGQCFSYSETDEFEVYDTNGRIVSKERGKISFLRKIILDFLFDLKHTRVFQTSPHYEYIYSYIEEHYFLGSLLKKADFYYYRELLADRLEGVEAEQGKLYGEMLLKAEAKWTEAIRNPLSDEVFAASGGWFDTPEEEMNKIYLANNRSRESTIYSDKLSPHSLLKTSYLLSSKWYMKRFALPNLFRILFPEEARLLCRALLIFSLSFFYIRILHPEYFSQKQLIALLLPYLVLIGSPIFVAHSEFWRVRHFWGIHVLIPRLFIAIVAGWVTISMGSDMLGFDVVVRQGEETPLESFLYTGGKRSWLLAFSFLLSMLVLIFYQIGKYNPYGQGRTRAGINPRERRKNYRIYLGSKLKKSIALLLIGWIYSFCTGLFVFSLLTHENGFWANLFHFHLHKKMLLYTFFAQFIGVFIQLTFEEKPMTEEL